MLNQYNTKKGKLSLNIITNISNLLLTISIGIFIVPFLIHNLGIDFYGVIPLANYFLQYVTLSTMALNSAVGRYITIALESDQFEASNQIFNTALFGNILIVTFLILILIPFVLHLDSLVNLPIGGESASKFMFCCTLIGFFISVTSSPFAVSTWCLNRFDLSNGISIARQSIYLGLIILLFHAFSATLYLVGIAIVVSAIVTAVLNYFVCRRLLSHLHVSLNHFRKDSLRKLFSTGGWITINKIGSILYYNIDLIIINRFFGVYNAGQYAAVLQLSVVLRMLGAAVSNVLGPPLTYLYAQSKMAELATYSRNSVKYLGLVMALPIGILSGFSKPILSLWLGNDFEKFSILIILLTVHLCINISVYPLFELQTAMNKVFLPGILTCIMGVANLALSLGLIAWTNLGIYGVAISGAILLTIKNAIFTPIYAALITRQPWYVFLLELLYISISTLSIIIMTFLLQYIIEIESFLKLLLWSLIICIFHFVLVMIVFLSNNERMYFIYACQRLFVKVGFSYARK